MEVWILASIVVCAVALLILLIVTTSLIMRYCACCQRDQFDIEKIHRESVHLGFDKGTTIGTANAVTPDLARHYKY